MLTHGAPRVYPSEFAWPPCCQQLEVALERAAAILGMLWDYECMPDRSRKRPRAMAAGITNGVWTYKDIAALLD